MSPIIAKSMFSVIRNAVRFAIVVIIFTMGSFATKAQSAAETAEAEIRKLEAEQINFLMNGELAKMKENWAPNYTVNNPFNVVQDAATGPIQTGSLTYHKFERDIEKVLVHDDVVIVMGSELVFPKTAPKGSSHDTDQPIKRRFTNVWMRKDGKWLMIARHASNICSN
jgi:hypothetical protein